jgi:enterochelin esterase-like enzyme
MPFVAYLPPGYDTAATRYPVLYMLHGLGGSEHDWERLGLFTTATSLIQSGEIQPMIIVTPAGESGYWVDHAANGPRFGSYVSTDLVETIDGEYRTQADRSARAIGGMSMGGHGALQLALNNPGEFAVVGAHSVALRRYEQAFPYYGDRRYFESHDPVSLCARNAPLVRNFTIWIDIGRDDVWFPSARAFEAQLTNAGIPHEWHANEGGHDAAYWSSHLSDYLHFYDRAFSGLEGPSVALGQR